MKSRILFLPLLFWLTAFSTPVQALPSIETLQGVIPICAGGRSVKVQGSLRASLKKWLTTASAEGQGSIDDIGAIIEKTKDDSIRVQALDVYHNCVKYMVQTLLEFDAKQESEKSEKETSSRVNLEIDGENTQAKNIGNVGSNSGGSSSKVDIKIKGNNTVLDGIGNATSK